MWCDDEGAISLLSNTSHHSRAKHINIKYHLIHSHIKEGTFKIIHVCSKDNGTDILTKPLPANAHAYLVKLLLLVYEKWDWPALTWDMPIISKHGMGKGPLALYIRHLSLSARRVTSDMSPLPCESSRPPECNSVV